MKPPSDYAYAAARLHSIENRMPGTEDLERLCGAGSLEDAFRLISEWGYGAKPAGPGRDDSALSDELEKTYSLVSDMIDDRRYLEIFLLKTDYHNLKVALKEQSFSSDHSHLFMKGGTWKAAELRERIRERDYRGFSAKMREAVVNAFEAMGRTEDPQLIDIILDKACFGECVERAGALGSGFLEGYIRMNIDLANIRSYIRVRRYGLKADFLANILIKGGRVETGAYLKHLGGGADGIMDVFRNTKYEELVGLGIEALQKDGALSGFERKADDIVVSYIKPYRYSPFGIGPVLSHIIAKEYEIMNIRIILSGVENGLAPEIIKGRIRAVYA